MKLIKVIEYTNVYRASIGTGSIAGGLLQIVWLVMDVFIYAPFVIASNKLKDEESSDESN